LKTKDNFRLPLCLCQAESHVHRRAYDRDAKSLEEHAPACKVSAIFLYSQSLPPLATPQETCAPYRVPSACNRISGASETSAVLESDCRFRPRAIRIVDAKTPKPSLHLPNSPGCRLVRQCAPRAGCKFIKWLICKVISALSVTCLVIWRREWDSNPR
jgi:hypothetical protein